MKCLAFVIGISDYDHRKKLPNARKDAVDIANTLSQLKFEVEPIFDCTHSEANAKLYEIEDKLRDGQYEAVVVYYAGHGEIINGTDCLLMKDVPLPDSSADIKPRAWSLSVDEIMKDFNGIGNQTNIFIIDACRVSSDASRGSAATYGTTIGKIPYQTFIAFSTSPGDTAKDGKKGANSPFAEALLAHILEEDLDIEMLFKKVRNDIKAKGYSQYPWEHTCLLDRFCFNHGQMSKYYDQPYSEDLYKRNNYKANPDSTEDNIIKNLSSDPDGQKNALSLLTVGYKDLTESQKFHIGRLIYDRAAGGSEICRSFLRKVSNIEKMKVGNQNDFLRGIYYEVFFNGNDEFRERPYGDVEMLTALESLRERIQDKDSENFVLEYIPEGIETIGYLLGKTDDHKFNIRLSQSELLDYEWRHVYQIEKITLHNRNILPDTKKVLGNMLIDWTNLRYLLADIYRLPLQKIKIRSNIAKDGSWDYVSFADELPDIYEYIVEICANETPGEVDALSSLSYIDEVEDCTVTEIHQEDNLFTIKGSINVSVHLEYDGEDAGNMSFPGNYTISLIKNGEDEWAIVDPTYIRIDTSRFYK